MKSQWFGRSAAIGQYPTYNSSSVLGVLAFMFIAIALILLAALLGASLAVGFWPLAAVLVGGVLALTFYAILGGRSAPGVRDFFFWLMFALIFATASLQKTAGFSASFILELSLILAAPLLVKPLARLLAESRFFKWWFAAFSVFLVLSVLSSIFGRSHIVAAAFQFLTNLKVILVLLLGFYIVWSARTNAVFWWIVRWLWLPMLLLVAWQWGHPASYFGVMGYAAATADPLQLFPSRALGPFQHPSYLAVYSGIFAIFCVLNAALGAGRRYVLLGLIYFLLLLASTQRQETAATVVGAIAVLSLVHGKRFAVRSVLLSTLAALVVGGAGWLIMKDNLISEATRWGIIGHSAIQQPRQVLYMHAVEIADKYAPLGSGLGTFAGAGAQKFDISLYLDRGFARYPWFYEQNVMMDTYWTNFLAETGWGPTLLWISLTVLLVWYTGKHSLMKYPPELRRAWLMAFGGISFTFLLSLTSPSFQDPGLFLVPGIFLGVAYNRTAAWKQTEKKG